MSDVFISYHRSEGTSALVRRIADELESMGVSCWYDTKDPDPGYFTQTIEREILRCKVFLLIWDEGANNSEWCLTETYTAFEGENHAVRIPFQIGQFTKHPEMAFYMQRCQIFSHESPENADITKLIVKISAYIEKTSVKTNEPPLRVAQSSPETQKPLVKIIKSGPCGDNVTYTLDASGLLTISGSGKMRDYDYSNTPWWNQRELILHAQIQSGVTSIGEYAFYGCGKLNSIRIYNSVMEIGACAFCHCHNLKAPKFPNKLTVIGEGAFFSCSSLALVRIPDSVKKIEWATFQRCTNLISIRLSKQITEIEMGTFQQCVRLTSIKIPDKAFEIGRCAFDGCVSLESVIIPDTINYIDEYVFFGCDSLKSVSVPANAKIAANAFPDTTEVIRRE